MHAQVTRSMQEHADVLIARSHTWAEGIRHADGLHTYQFSSSRQRKDGSYAMYFASELGCTCPSFWHRGQCAHVVAIRQVADRAREAAAVKPRARYEELMDNHLVSAF